MLDDVKHYLDSWAIYRIDCEIRVKNRAKINNEGWRKLRQYHLEQYVSNLPCSFGFMFALRYKHKNIYKSISCAKSVYDVALRKRHQQFEVRR